MWDPYTAVDRDLSDMLLPMSLLTGPSLTEIFDRSFDVAKGIKFNISETDQAFEIEASLPGLKKEDVKVTLKDDVLTISGEKSFEKEKSKKNYTRVEHTYGFFSRSIRIPPNVDTSKLSANLDNGILRITFPKKQQESKGQNIQVTEGQQQGQQGQLSPGQEGQNQQGQQGQQGRQSQFRDETKERTGQEESSEKSSGTPLSHENTEVPISS